MITDKELETIEKYLDGLLSGDDLSNFERRLEKEDAIAQQVVSMKALRYTAKESVLRDKKKMLEQWDVGMGEVEESGGVEVEDEQSKLGKRNVEQNKLAKWAFGAFILLAMIVGITVLLSKGPSEPEFYVDNFIPPDSPIEIKRSSEIDNIDEERVFAYNLYAIKEYKQAAIELERLYLDRQDKEALKYALYSNVAAGDFESYFRLLKHDGTILNDKEIQTLNKLVKRK